MESQGIAVKEIEDPASTVVYVGRIPDKDGRPEFLGTILIRDIIKKEAREAIEAMRNAGVEEVIMLTGDRTSVGEAVGRELQVDRVYADLLPQDKVRCVEKLLQERNTEEQVLGFVGDGINDAPVLARADVGIAMGSMGSDAAIEAADVVIMDDDLMRIPQVTKIAHGTLSISKENIVFALAVKILILILGALGIANMWAAVFADVGVAVLCILNSMRLITIKKTI
jgi:Cd2+/Zn2+-exporting ATPase